MDCLTITATVITQIHTSESTINCLYLKSLNISFFIIYQYCFSEKRQHKTLKMQPKTNKPRIFLLFALFILCAQVHAQKWVELLSDPNVSFFEVQKAFESEWKGKSYESGKGYKQFRRLEAFIVPRLNEKGFYDSAKTWKTYYEYLEKNKAIIEEKSSVANWSTLGPVNTPSPSTWNNEGIGRIDCIAFHPTNPDEYWVGAPSGGLWKTTNNGVSWTPYSDAWAGMGVSDIAIDPNNPNNMFVATGSREGSSPASYFGIRTSTDGGLTWNTISGPPLVSSFAKMYRLLIDPSNSNKLIAATSEGVFYSTNSGSTWTQSTGTSNNTVYDIEFKPGNTSVIYAAEYGHICKSTNGGVSFTPSTVPFAPADVTRISLAVSANQVNNVYIACANTSNALQGMYKSTDSGNTFTAFAIPTDPVTYVNGSAYPADLGNTLGSQGWYDWTLGVSPNNADEIYMGGVSMVHSTDGGSTWAIVSTSSNGGGSVHVDMHATEFHPITGEFYTGCDGGVYRRTSTTTGNWDRLNNTLAVTQTYRLGSSISNPDIMLIGNQDNGVFEYNTGNWIYRRIGDGMECIIDPRNDLIMYSSTQRGNVRRSSNGAVTWIDAINQTTTGQSPNWTIPFIMDETNPDILYAGFDDVWKSVDAGYTWTNASNGPLDDNLIFLEVSFSDPNVLYTGDSYAIYKSIDGGFTWTTQTNPGLTSFSSQMIDIAIDDTDANTLWATKSNGLVYKSTDGGLNWTDESAGLPAIMANSIVHQRGTNDELYLGMDIGVYYKNGNANWVLYNTNLPSVIVKELEINYCTNKLRAATYGRGIWESDLENFNTFCCPDEIPVLSPAGIVEDCTGTPITITADTAPSGATYQWYKDGVLLSGETNSSLNVSESGAYTAAFIGACIPYQSQATVFKIVCAVDACEDMNTATASGPGNTTIVSVTGPFPTIDPIATTIEICATVEGDANWSNEVFNVIDENGTTHGITNIGSSDCDGPTPPFCFTVPIADYNTWIADNIITVTFDPPYTDVNPNLCAIHQVCASVKVPVEATSCLATDHYGGTILDNTYTVSNLITADGNVPSSGNVTFQAGNCIELQADFTVDLGADFLAEIQGCSPFAPNTPTNTRLGQSKDWTAYRKNQTEYIWISNEIHTLTEHKTSDYAHSSYQLHLDKQLKVELYDKNNVLQKTLFEGKQLAGTHQLHFDTSHLPAGVYTLVFQTENCTSNARLVLDK